MAKVRWTEDYGQYKKGDEFDINDAGTLEYLTASGKIEPIEEKKAKAEHKEPEDKKTAKK